MRTIRVTLVVWCLVLLEPARAWAESGGTAATVGFTNLSLPALPKQGSGAFAGSSGNALIVAGGIGNDQVFVLPAGETSAWQQFKMIQPMAWGTSATIGDSLICVGGIDGQKCSDAVLRLRWQSGQLSQERLPDLPEPLGLAGAGVLGQSVYVVGGVNRPDATADNELFRLDLSSANPQWQVLPPLPGPGRAQPIVTGQYYMIQIFGGEVAGIGSQALSDCWTFRPRPLDGTSVSGWVRAADLPRAMAGGAAVPSGQAHTLVLGPDASYTDVLAYHAVTDTWMVLGQSPPGLSFPIATTWQGKTILVGNGGSIVQMDVQRSVAHLHMIDYIVVAGYLLLVTSIGLFFAKRQKTTEEFALGGRRMTWWVTALSLYATATSSISMMAVPALAFASNLVWLLLPILTLAVLIPQAFLIIPLIRRLNLTSTYEYLERRFNPSLRMLASLQCIIFYAVGKASIVILLPSIAIQAVTGLNVYYSVGAMGLLTTLYTSLGGIDAVMWTDVLQAMVMLLAPLLILIAAIHGLGGGVHEFITTGTHYGKFDMTIWSWNPTEPVVWIFVATALLQITGFAGDQSMVQRVLATPNDKVARKATIGNWAVCFGGAVLVQIMGIALFAFFHAHPEKLDPTMTNDKVVPLFVVQVMPAGVAGLILAGLFASSMSCLSGVVNSVSTLIVQDFYLRWRPNASDRTKLRLLKILSYVAGLVGTGIAALLAGMQFRSLQETWQIIGALLGAGFVGVYTLGMFSRRATGAGALIGACASVIIACWARFETSLHWTLYLPLSIISCTVIGYVASLLLPAPKRDLTGLTAYTVGKSAGIAGMPAVTTSH